MLVITRKKTEKFTMILPDSSDTIEVTITDINGPQVRLGIEAPDDIKIIRNELLTRDSKGR